MSTYLTKSKYPYDAGFQTWVMHKAYPEFNVRLIITKNRNTVNKLIF
jgi:hypothetical protein